MQQSTRLAAVIQRRIDAEISRHRAELAPLGADIVPVLDEAEAFLTGGKRFRAQFACTGARAVESFAFDVPAGTLTPEAEAVLDAACALEIFHAAALIHDDVFDRSDTRRGRPATHRLFGNLHRGYGWRGDADRFGETAATLLGDLLQSWADELMQRACDRHPSTGAAERARSHFNRMRSEVALGQYLDVLEEQRAEFADHEEQLERSTRVLVYKSAKYSVEAPLLIGSALAGATSEQESSLAAFGLPIGVAFQLRDDLLGVFGDATVTGKPAGDDLAEGKRTVLITLARDRMPVSQRRIIDGLLGTELDGEQVSMMQRTIAETGAVDEVERMIAVNLRRALDALEGTPLREDARDDLAKLAERAVVRSA